MLEFHVPRAPGNIFPTKRPTDISVDSLCCLEYEYNIIANGDFLYFLTVDGRAAFDLQHPVLFMVAKNERSYN